MAHPDITPPLDIQIIVLETHSPFLSNPALSSTCFPNPFLSRIVPPATVHIRIRFFAYTLPSSLFSLHYVFQTSPSAAATATPIPLTRLIKIHHSIATPAAQTAIGKPLPPPPPLSFSHRVALFHNLHDNQLQLPLHSGRPSPPAPHPQTGCHHRLHPCLGFRALPNPLPFIDPYVPPANITTAELAYTGFLAAFFSGFWVEAMQSLLHELEVLPVTDRTHHEHKLAKAHCKLLLSLANVEYALHFLAQRGVRTFIHPGFRRMMMALVCRHLPEANSRAPFVFLQSLLEEPTSAFPNPNLQPDNTWQSIAVLPPDWQDSWIPAEQRNRIINCEELAMTCDQLMSHGFLGSLEDLYSAQVLSGDKLSNYCWSLAIPMLSVYNPETEEQHPPAYVVTCHPLPSHSGIQPRLLLLTLRTLGFQTIPHIFLKPTVPQKVCLPLFHYPGGEASDKGHSFRALPFLLCTVDPQCRPHTPYPYPASRTRHFSTPAFISSSRPYLLGRLAGSRANPPFRLHAHWHTLTGQRVFSPASPLALSGVWCGV
ncbi:hypothetical protein C8J57DRAFT_1508641 [Mycena rebaudengoi]|nr:hypothetical protein C8J57DRAFT_1508641 [Mycena rebaudengoi]